MLRSVLLAYYELFTYFNFKWPSTIQKNYSIKSNVQISINNLKNNFIYHWILIESKF